MSKKQADKKAKKAELSLTSEEVRELEMILDRLQVQDPKGETLANYLQSLQQVLIGRENLISALVERLSRTPSEVGFRTFLVLKELLTSKLYRRLLKQAAYRFTQKGYAIEEQVETDRRVVLIPKESRKTSAHFIPTPGAYRFVLALVPFEDLASSAAVSVALGGGLQELEVQVIESSQRLYKDFLKKTEDHFSVKAYEIPIGHAARLIFEMVDLVRVYGINSETERALNLLGPFHDPETLPYPYEIMPPLKHQEIRLGDIDVFDLLGNLHLEGILFSKDSLAPYWERIKALEHSTLIVRRELQEERAQQVMREAIDELCTEETRYFYQRFFEEEALRFKLSKSDDLAGSAWSVAQHIRAGFNASDNPVLSRIFGISLFSHWQEDFDKSQENTTQEEDQPAPAGFYRTDSGLIVPK